MLHGYISRLYLLCLVIIFAPLSTEYGDYEIREVAIRVAVNVGARPPIEY